MPRNMSFALTTEQFKNRTKRVTRRNGWWFLVREDHVMGVEKGMGLKKGEKIVRLGLIIIEDAFPEPLGDITDDEVILEGFPELGRLGFVEMYTKHNGCDARDIVNRIAFDYL